MLGTRRLRRDKKQTPGIRLPSRAHSRIPRMTKFGLYPEVDETIRNTITKYGGVENVESVSYSNGGRLCHYANREYGIEETSFDPVVGIKQTKEWLTQGMRAPMEYVRTTTTPIAMGGGQNLIDLLRVGVPPTNVNSPLWLH